MYLAGTDDDVVDRDEDKLDEEADEPHHHESDRRPHCYLRELCISIQSKRIKKHPKKGEKSTEIQIHRRQTLAIRLVAALDKPNAIFGEFPKGINDGIEGIHQSKREREGNGETKP